MYGSRLIFKEYVDARYRMEKLSYSYHYQDAEEKLIFRYDNAAHKPPMPYACHKHLSDGTNTEAAAPEFADLMEEAMERFLP